MDSIHIIKKELDRAKAKFPTWPTDPLHALAVVQEEVGELQKEVLQLCYEPNKADFEAVKKEAIQAAAMAIRFVESLHRYEFNPGIQHPQRDLCPFCDRGDQKADHNEDCPNRLIL